MTRTPGPERDAAPAPFRDPAGPRMRVVMDNDYSGDPDGLYQLVHHLLSPSVDVRAVIGSALLPGDPFAPGGKAATSARARAEDVLALMDLQGRIPALEGSNEPLADRRTPRPSPGAEALVSEAMRTDTDLPLYAVFGASLTQLASAYLMEPGIQDRLTAVWIGGPEYPGVAAPPGADPAEYNLRIDVIAAQVVFNDSAIPLWQVPRNAYRHAIVGMSELEAHVRPLGPLGAHLFDAIARVFERAARHGAALGEAYVLGDSPLVLLTALQSTFQPDPSSSRYEVVPAPEIGDDGAYVPGSGGRDIRVYTDLDVRLMVGDFLAKLRGFHESGAAHSRR
ncbi:MAG TPA: nucleoside hydrolase [Solirubrobacteraceae bacterium]|nr:nucleoside hydrolase [Solirubrobacteraceae bacterium]